MANKRASILFPPTISSRLFEASRTDRLRVGMCMTLKIGSKLSIKKVHNMRIWVGEGCNDRSLAFCKSTPNILAERAEEELDDSDSGGNRESSSSSDTSFNVCRRPSTYHEPKYQ